MRILITGSNGYIGSSLSKSLKEYDVTSLSRETVNLLDINSVNNFFIDKNFDVIIHCASVGGNRLIPDDDYVYDQNITMFNNIISNKDKFIKLISFGTGVESTDTSPYSRSKSVIRNIVTNTPNFYNIKVFAVFDENELGRRFIKSNITRYIKKESIKIHQDKVMDFFYMEDLVNLVKFYINNDDQPKEIDCSYVNKKTLLEVSKIINSLGDYEVTIDIENKTLGNPYVGNGLFLDGLPLNLIGLEEGIKKTYKKCI